MLLMTSGTAVAIEKSKIQESPFAGISLLRGSCVARVRVADACAVDQLCHLYTTVVGRQPPARHV